MKKALKIGVSGLFVISLIALNSCATNSRTINRVSAGIVCQGGIYVSESADEHISILNDTLRLYKSVEGTAEMLAECSMERIKDNWYRISSLQGFQQAPFSEMSVNMSESRISATEIKITIATPNCARPLWVSLLYANIKHIDTVVKNGVATVTIPLCSEFTISLGYADITPSVPSGRFYGLTEYSKMVKLENNIIKIIEIVLPNVTEKILDRYYIDNEFIYATDSCIYRKGVKFVKKQ